MKVAPALAVWTFACVALAAPTKKQCVDADTWGQSHRQEGKLHAARADFRVCLDPGCPEIVRSDCRMRIEDVDRVMPSVVFEAPIDLSDAKLTMDGVSVAASTDPIDVDPGTHHFVLRVRDFAPVERDVNVAEGEKAKRVTFDRPTAALPSPSPAPTGARGIAPLRLVGIVTGTVGVVGLGLGAAFGLASFAAWSSVESECFQAAVCDKSRAVADRQRTLDFAAASDVAFVVGGVLAAAGVTLVVLGGHASPTVTRDGVGLAFTRTF